MEEGIFKNSTEIYFGNGMLEKCLDEKLSENLKICLVTGNKSYLNTGIKSRLEKIFAKKNINFFHVVNKNHNPDASIIYDSLKDLKKFDPNLIMGVGGGSVIDLAKTISIAIDCEHDFWNFYLQKKSPNLFRKVCAILTLSGSGSESSDGGTITKDGKKIGFGHPQMRPLFSILEPNIISKAPEKLIRVGICDSICHVLERYFTNTNDVTCSDEICLGILKTLIKYGLEFSNNSFSETCFPDLIWAQKLAHDNTAGFGRKQDWATHGIAHEIGVKSDAPHGAIVSIIFPKWMKFVEKKNKSKKFEDLKNYFLKLNYMEINKSNLTCDEIFNLYFSKIIPEYNNLEKINIFKSNYYEISREAVKINPSLTLGNFIRLNENDVYSILNN